VQHWFNEEVGILLKVGKRSAKQQSTLLKQGKETNESRTKVDEERRV